ncbi:CvpA family protein [Comamonas endophytica]|uniref:CvpA family protein n=1 Tax=Comamonas endophytica TaxID=2949090 RepID=A0ABY6G8A8_9BURK|nr:MULTISPECIES: CvpA family protein [unclassified Acidovorax]MCD2514124.1 CvpA family protein [Acidovorax sp. D4N7]UYG51264.1 CvpA family protein [Acidovorax sp. 5MLIR]
MGALDWIFLAIVLASLLLGAWRGLVYELLSLVGWLVAFVAARYGAGNMANWLPLGGSDPSVQYAVGFVVLFIAVAFAWGLVSSLAKRLIESVGLRPVDRTLGAVFGLLRAALLLVVVTLVVGFTPLRQSEWWQQSVFAPHLAGVLQGWMPALPQWPQEWGRYLPSR